MAPTTTIPVTVTPEASDYVDELGMRGQFEQMIEHTRRTMAGLRAIHVTLQPPYDLGGGPCVLIEATTDDPHLEYDPSQGEWARWQVGAFPPEVNQHFVLLVVHGPDCAK
jgi:hypothetical protein